LKVLEPPDWLAKTPLFCTACGKALKRLPPDDPWAYDLGCAADHRFFMMLGGPSASVAAKAEALAAPELAKLDDEAVIRRWLTDEKLRPMLDNELARLIARIGGKRRVPEAPTFTLCPLHAQAMRVEFHNDPQTRGFQCPKGHDLAERYRKLWFKTEGHAVALSAEYSDAELREIVDRWLGPDVALQAKLHPSLREALESFSAR
jgi:hypothetical protein